MTQFCKNIEIGEMKNARLESKAAKRDITLWLIITVILVLAVFANNYFSHQAIAIRLIGWIIVVVASLFLWGIDTLLLWAVSFLTG